VASSGSYAAVLVPYTREDGSDGTFVGYIYSSDPGVEVSGAKNGDYLYRPGLRPILGEGNHVLTLSDFDEALEDGEKVTAKAPIVITAAVKSEECIIDWLDRLYNCGVHGYAGAHWYSFKLEFQVSDIRLN